MNEYISKEAILKELDNTINRCKKEPICNVDASDVCSAISRFIENMQAVDVQPINQWISVDERLPKPFEKVLCYCISTSGDLDFYMIGCINKHWGLLKGETFVSEKETHRIVVYWQPLPPRPTFDYCRFCN